DDEGRVIVTGHTASGGFPAVAAAQSTLKGSGDGFLSVFGPDGTHLLASRFLGGMQDDTVRAMVPGPHDSVFLAGQTSSADFPAGLGGAPLDAAAVTPFVPITQTAFVVQVSLVGAVVPAHVPCGQLAGMVPSADLTTGLAACEVAVPGRVRAA